MPLETIRARPILFSGPMVRALLREDDPKTQTRRVIRDTGFYAIDAAIHGEVIAGRERKAIATRCLYGQIGGTLWVREACRCTGGGNWHGVVYRAENDSNLKEFRAAYRELKLDSLGRKTLPKKLHAEWRRLGCGWRPSIHMPRWASRITLEITAVRVERLQEMHHKTEEFESEGFELPPTELWPHENRSDKLEAVFTKSWNALNAKRGYSWESNPWVFVISFRRLTPC